jgi:uncharacterized protein
MEYKFLSFRIFLTLVAAISIADLAFAQTKIRLSVATGGTGGVYYPVGGGMAALISRNIPALRRRLRSPPPLSTI